MWKREVKSIILVALSAACMAFNINSFVNVVGLYPGGFTGIALLVQRAGSSFFQVGIAFSLISYPLNILALLLSYKSLGRRFLIYTCLSVGLCGLLTDIIPALPITDDVLLASVFGGIINGLGMSLILNNNASSGGTDFIAMTLSAKYKISTFNYMLLFSAAVILTSGFLFGMDKALYLSLIHI